MSAGFLLISGRLEMEYWLIMDYSGCKKISTNISDIFFKFIINHKIS